MHSSIPGVHRVPVGAFSLHRSCIVVVIVVIVWIIVVKLLVGWSQSGVIVIVVIDIVIVYCPTLILRVEGVELLRQESLVKQLFIRIFFHFIVIVEIVSRIEAVIEDILALVGRNGVRGIRWAMVVVIGAISLVYLL